MYLCKNATSLLVLRSLPLTLAGLQTSLIREIPAHGGHTLRIAALASGLAENAGYFGHRTSATFR